MAGVAAIVGVSATGLLGERKKEKASGSEITGPQLPGGGTTILPGRRVVAFFGVPGGGKELGVLGVGSPTEAAEKLRDQAYPYDTDKPLLPAFELIATIAHDFPSDGGLYRSRLTDDQIDRYLTVARQEGAILILDIQPGHARWMDEVRHYKKYLEMPDVSLALDPEWSLPKGTIPGKEIGSIKAEQINEVSAYLESIVKKNNLPQKLLVVHQFKEYQLKNRKAVVERPGVALVINVDGFGPAEAKIGNYEDLTSEQRQGKQFFNGFKLFYEEDTRNGGVLMQPSEVLALEPQPDVIVYE